MPARSERQRRYLINRFGIGWVRRHHFNRIRRRKEPSLPRQQRKG